MMLCVSLSRKAFGEGKCRQCVTWCFYFESGRSNSVIHDIGGFMLTRASWHTWQRSQPRATRKPVSALFKWLSLPLNAQSCLVRYRSFARLCSAAAVVHRRVRSSQSARITFATLSFTESFFNKKSLICNYCSSATSMRFTSCICKNQT